MNQRTAILLFSRTATAEAGAKAYGADQRCARVIAAALLKRTRRTLSRSGLPVRRVDERAQQGASFGERLARAASELFSRGYERLIIVGNDAPLLRPGHLRRAAAALSAGRTVIGPDRRGGIYLVGLQRDSFDATAFAALDWQTDRLGSQLSELLRQEIYLDELGDINALADLRRGWHQLRSLLGELHVTVWKAVTCYSATKLTTQYSGTRYGGRAPPIGG